MVKYNITKRESPKVWIGGLEGDDADAMHLQATVLKTFPLSYRFKAGMQY